ncbi:hypothetical protein ACIBF1_03030 [Spirillospora sp. NPDC050679]
MEQIFRARDGREGSEGGGDATTIERVVREYDARRPHAAPPAGRPRAGMA